MDVINNIMNKIFEAYINDTNNSLVLQELEDWYQNKVIINEQLTLNMPIANQQMATALGKSSVKDLMSVSSFLNIPPIAAIKAYLIATLKFIKFAALSVLSSAALAQLIGWMFIGIAKIINKNVKNNLEARQALVNSKIINTLKDAELSDEIFITRYKELRKEITNKLNKEIPIKRGENWANILNNVGNKIKGKYGMAIFALASLFLYGNIASIPIFPSAASAASAIPIIATA